MALLLGLSLYTATYIAEIVRAGILAVAHGQTEAAYALGPAAGPTLRLVVIPQAMRVIIPPLTSQYLNLTKNSSLAVAIGYPDLVSVFCRHGPQPDRPGGRGDLHHHGRLPRDQPGDVAVHELVQPARRPGGALGDDHRLRPGLRAPRGGAGRWRRRRARRARSAGCAATSSPRSPTRSSRCSRVALRRLDRAADHPLGLHRRGLDGQRPRGLPRLRSRRLLGLRQGASSASSCMAAIRSTSAGGST